jgi:hypothetical protein
VGRSAVLEKLMQRLLTDKACPQMAIVGLGGIGKYQVALEFTYRGKEHYPEYSIFWIQALSMESMEQACRNIARIRGIPQEADDMNLILGTEKSKGIADYLPASENGLILFTTRHRLASQHELASAYRADGQIKKAVELQEPVIAAMPKAFREETSHSAHYGTETRVIPIEGTSQVLATGRKRGNERNSQQASRRLTVLSNSFSLIGSSC